jgi:hypothetical protein
VSGVNTVLAILEQRKKDSSVLISGNISVRDALRTKGDEAKRVMLKELSKTMSKTRGSAKKKKHNFC